MILAITIAEVPRVVRLVRSVVLTLREQPYVEAAIANGTRTPRILVRHILPNTLAPLIVQATYICASAMITEAILSFLGAGTPPNIPSWGNIMAEGAQLFQIAAYIILFPGLFLSLTVLAVNLLGDGLRDALDPRLARQDVGGRMPSAAPLLEIDGPEDPFLHARRRRARGRRRLVLGRAGRDAGDRRRIRLRQERHRAVDPAPDRLAAGPHRRGHASASRARDLLDAVRARDARRCAATRSR